MRDLTAISLFLHDLKTHRSEGKPLLVALDGRCASGKTLLARQLQQDFNWSVVHLDHFFLRPQQRTPERLATPGENVDHERFLEEVLKPLRAGQPVCYRPYDCHTGCFGEAVELPSSPVTLVEGAYACHPRLWPFYDMRVFMTVAPQEQLRRLERREGGEKLKEFLEKWIPLEEAYIAAYDLESRCDYRLES